LNEKITLVFGVGAVRRNPGSDSVLSFTVTAVMAVAFPEEGFSGLIVERGVVPFAHFDRAHAL
jgi:hypothetical protein